MLKMLAIAGLAALMAACAAPAPDVAVQRGSTAGGEATAAQMGFHGPVYRANKADGPN